MSHVSPTPTKKYDLSFARWVAQHVDGGERMNMCMQCGTCSGSCPIGSQMDFGPRKIFMMIRAGMKDAVLKSNTIWNCVSCYNCVVRCPRQVPVKYILQSLATVAVREGYAEAKATDNARFASAFWWSAAKFGRTDERLVTAKFYFSYGVGEGYKKSMANLPIAIGMVKTKRMHLGMPHKCKNTGELQKILAKAAEIEARHAK
jgi:quinone-modifying oxidoreductase subunit QmoC